MIKVFQPGANDSNVHMRKLDNKLSFILKCYKDEVLSFFTMAISYYRKRTDELTRGVLIFLQIVFKYCTILYNFTFPGSNFQVCQEHTIDIFLF